MFCGTCGTQIGEGLRKCPNCNANLQPSVIDFNNIDIVFGKQANGYSCYVYPKISSNCACKVRDKFGIGFDEEILLVRDTSFWKSLDQGLCLTDRYIYVIPDKEQKSSKFTLDWYDIKNVVYKDLILRFFDYKNRSTPININLFTSSDKDNINNPIGQQAVILFNDIAKSLSQEDSDWHIAIATYRNFINQERYDDAIRFAYECKDSIDNGMLVYFESVEACNLLGDINRAIDICDECLNFYDSDDNIIGRIISKKGECLLKQKRFAESRKILKQAISLIPNHLRDANTDEIYIETAKQNFNTADESYICNFTELPYNQRKLIVPVKTYTTLDQSSITVITLDQLAKSRVSFPIGHPIVNQMYVGHPYIADKYIPFDRYELELIEDKVREFCQIAQSLGAVEITIDSSNSKMNESHKNVIQNSTIEAKDESVAISANVSKAESSDNSLITEISQTINLNQRYTPKGGITLPDNLVWYPYEASWQRLYEQRLAGTLNHHEEKIEVRKNRVVDGAESNAVSAEVECLMLSINAHMDKTTREKLSNQENAILSIHVDFATLDTLSVGGGTQQISKSASYTPDEEEYLQEVKECIADFGEINDRGRRLLSRIQKSLGISDERAAELEASLAPSLTDEEKEYLEEYKLCLEESGEISGAERRLLNRLRTTLNISEERAAEIETYC